MSGADEVANHAIGIGGNGEPFDGCAELPRVVCGENVAEVAGGDDDIKGLSQASSAVKVVADLREKTADVDAVGRGEQATCGAGTFGQLGICEGCFDGGLRIVKVPLNRTGGDI